MWSVISAGVCVWGRGGGNCRGQKLKISILSKYDETMLKCNPLRTPPPKYWLPPPQRLDSELSYNKI